MEHLLSDAKQLVQRLHAHDCVADTLISETLNLQNKLVAMRQYRDEVIKLNEVACHRPKSTLILGSQLENQRIQDLEHENRELHISLAEHQSALELIMSKYREQMVSLLKLNNDDNGVVEAIGKHSYEEKAMKEKISEMASVMHKAASIDEDLADKEAEMRRCLQVENQNLRELLDISKTQWKRKPKAPSEPSSPMSDAFDQTSFFIDNVGSRGQLFSDSGSDTSVESVRYVVATPLLDIESGYMNSSDSGIVDCNNKIITSVTLLDKDYDQDQQESLETAAEVRNLDSDFLQVKEEALDCSTPTPEQFLNEPQYPIYTNSEDDDTVSDDPTSPENSIDEVVDDIQLNQKISHINKFPDSDKNLELLAENFDNLTYNVVEPKKAILKTEIVENLPDKTFETNTEADTKHTKNVTIISSAAEKNRVENIENTEAVKNLTNIFIDYSREEPCTTSTTSVSLKDDQESTSSDDITLQVSEDEDLDTLEFDQDDIDSVLSGFDSIIDEEDNLDNDDL